MFREEWVRAVRGSMVVLRATSEMKCKCVFRSPRKHHRNMLGSVRTAKGRTSLSSNWFWVKQYV